MKIRINDLNVRPCYSHLRTSNKFVEVFECKNCGIIGDSHYCFESKVCPNCGHDGKDRLIAKWEEYTKVVGPAFVWYNPFTWFARHSITIGGWVRRDTIEGKL